MSLSLRQLCVKEICENVTHLSIFAAFSPLPWCLTEEIIKNFGKYKWRQLMRRATSKMDIDFDVMQDFEYKLYIEPELQDTLLALNSYDFLTDHDYYCVWSQLYKIKKYNLILCDPCFRVFKEVLKNKRVKFSYKIEHFHDQYFSHQLPNKYQQKSSWCHNKFNEIVFELKERYECIEEIHSGQRKVKFFHTPMTSSSSSSDDDN